jgi:zinc protease
VIEKRVDKGIEPQSRAAMFFTGAFEHTQQQRIAIRALGEVLQARLHEALREDLGGTYGVTVGASYAQIPVPEYSVSINFSCAPDRTNELLKAAMTQVESLKATGPTEKEINDTREKMLRDQETSSKQNGYWVTQLLLRYQTGEPLDTLFAMPELYKKVTPKMIHDAAKRYLNPANRVTVTLFPEKKS